MELMGVKGRLQTNNYENEEGEKKKFTEVIAERLTFLTNRQDIIEKESKTEEEDLEV